MTNEQAANELKNYHRIEKFKLIDLMPILSVNFDTKIGVNGNFVGQFSIGDIPYRYLNLYVKCIYPMFNGEKKYTGIDLISEV